MTEAPRESETPRQGDPLAAFVGGERDAIEPASQPIVSEGTQPMHTAARSEAPGVNDASAATDEAIARRAYELYQARGGMDGADMDDWLQAERELRAGSELQSRGDFYGAPSDEPDVPDHRPMD
jgi:hypothetical protein